MPNTMMSTSNRIRSFVTTNFYVPDPESLPDHESLLEAGIVDSTGVVEIIAFIESEFGIRVEDREIVAENLDSIQGIEAFVTLKMSAAAPPPAPSPGLEAHAPAA